jgi:nucleoside-diphosphate-sugar epimerase
MNVLITGGTGFLGAYLARELVAGGHRPVLYDLQPIDENLRLAWGGPPSGIAIVRGDILDAFQMLEAVREHQVEAVVHLAYMLTNAAAENPARALQVNVIGTNNVFELARRLKLRRVLWASSGAVHKGYEGTGEVVEDESDGRPTTVYGYCKLLNEEMAGHYFERFGVDSIAFRLSFLTGIGKPTGLTSELIRQLFVNPALGRPAVVPFPEDRIGWLDVLDVARAFRRALEFPGRTRSRVFNLRPSPTTVREAIEIVRRLAPDARIEPGSGSNWGAGRNYGERFGRALEEEMGFQTDRPPEDLFRGIIEHVRANRAVVESVFGDGTAGE